MIFNVDLDGTKEVYSLDEFDKGDYVSVNDSMETHFYKVKSTEGEWNDQFIDLKVVKTTIPYEEDEISGLTHKYTMNGKEKWFENKLSPNQMIVDCNKLYKVIKVVKEDEKNVLQLEKVDVKMTNKVWSVKFKDEEETAMFGYKEALELVSYFRQKGEKAWIC